MSRLPRITFDGNGSSSQAASKEPAAAPVMPKAENSFKLSPIVLGMALPVVLVWVLTSPTDAMLKPMNLAWAGGLAVGTLVLAAAFAFAAFRVLGRSTAAGNGVCAMTLLAVAAVLGMLRGPFREQVMTGLNERWPEGAKLVAQLESHLPQPAAPAAGSTPKAEPAKTAGAQKGAPVVVVRRRDEVTAVTPSPGN